MNLAIQLKGVECKVTGNVVLSKGIRLPIQPGYMYVTNYHSWGTSISSVPVSDYKCGFED